MKKNEKKEPRADSLAGSEHAVEATLENFKRRRALIHPSAVNFRSKLFFERVLQIKKIREIAFCGRAR